MDDVNKEPPELRILRFSRVVNIIFILAYHAEDTLGVAEAQTRATDSNKTYSNASLGTTQSTLPREQTVLRGIVGVKEPPSMLWL